MRLLGLEVVVFIGVHYHDATKTQQECIEISIHEMLPAKSGTRRASVRPTPSFLQPRRVPDFQHGQGWIAIKIGDTPAKRPTDTQALSAPGVSPIFSTVKDGWSSKIGDTPGKRPTNPKLSPNQACPRSPRERNAPLAPPPPPEPVHGAAGRRTPRMHRLSAARQLSGLARSRRHPCRADPPRQSDPTPAGRPARGSRGERPRASVGRGRRHLRPALAPAPPTSSSPA